MRRINTFDEYFSLLESAIVEPIEQGEYDKITVPNLPYSSELTTDKESFLKKLSYICEKIGAKPEWMMINIAGESGFRPDAVNPTSGATGLIQFMPKVIANYLDPVSKQPLTTEDLKKMSIIDQLDIVYAYYKENMKSLNISKFEQPGDFFGVTFYPKILKELPDWQFPPNVVKSNQVLFARMGGITKKDYYDYCDRLVKDPESVKNSIKNFDSEGFFTKESGANDFSLNDLFGKELGKIADEVLQKGPASLAAMGNIVG